MRGLTKAEYDMLKDCVEDTDDGYADDNELSVIDSLESVGRLVWIKHPRLPDSQKAVPTYLGKLALKHCIVK